MYCNKERITGSAVSSNSIAIQKAHKRSVIKNVNKDGGR